MLPGELDSLYYEDPEAWAEALGLVLVGYEVFYHIRDERYTSSLQREPDGPMESYAVPLYKKKES